MSESVLEAVADHGRVSSGRRIARTYQDARRVLDYLDWFGVPYPEVLDSLEREGLEKFDRSWTELLDTIAVQLDKKRL